MIIDKHKFLLKALLVGILATSMSKYSYNDLGNVSINVPIWITTLVFIDYFRVILLLWIAFDYQVAIKNWVLAGFIGSLLYAILFLIFGQVISQETAKLLIILKQLLIGALSAIPIWFILKASYSKAYLWIVANAIGYAFLELYTTNIRLITSIGIISKAINYSFLTLQVVLDSIWVIAYALFGLLLGIFLYKIIENGKIESEVKSDV